MSSSTNIPTVDGGPRRPRRGQLSPEEVLDHALADLTLLAPDLRRLYTRANDTMPGPGASSSGGAAGFDIDDPRYDIAQPDTPAAKPAPTRSTPDEVMRRGRVTAPTATTSNDDDEHVDMKRDEARAINGPDPAEIAAHKANIALAEIRRQVGIINRELAPFRRAAKAFDPNDVPEDWCPNCYRQGGRRHTPSRKSKGRNHWEDGWCDFCGSFLAARRREDEEAGRDRDGWLPTRKILDIRYGPVGSGRITDQLITTEERKLPKALKAKGAGRKGRSPLFVR